MTFELPGCLSDPAVSLKDFVNVLGIVVGDSELFGCLVD